MQTKHMQMSRITKTLAYNTHAVQTYDKDAKHVVSVRFFAGEVTASHTHVFAQIPTESGSVAMHVTPHQM
jgi:hypothetical protein